MPPQNNRQPDVMEGLRALASLGMMAPRQPEPEPNPFGPAGTFAPEESGVWEPGIESLLPTGPIDMAVETILSGIMQDNPKLGIALGLFGPKVAKTVNVSGGRALSRRGYRKGFEKAKTDPMFHDIPFEELSEFMPIGQTRKHILASENIGEYRAAGGRRYFDPTSEISIMGKGPKPLGFTDYTLFELLNRPSALFGSLLPRTVFHEGAHFKQHMRGLAARGKDYRIISGGTMKPKPKYEPGGPFYRKFSPKTQKNMRETKVHQDKFNYLSNPIEIEARLEEIFSFGKKAAKSSRKDLKFLGYSDNQIDKMVKDYGDVRAYWYPPLK